MKRLFLLFLFLATFSFSIVIEMPLTEILKNSDLVFYGKVENSNSFWENGNIYTNVNFSVLDIIKGEEKKYYNLKILGGTVGDITQVVEDFPSFSKGEEVILFLKEGYLVGQFQGKISVLENFVFYKGKKYVLNDFIDSLKKYLKDPNHPILSSLIKTQPKVINFIKGQKNIFSNTAEVTAEIFSAGWEGEVDYDGDGFNQYAKIYWDADVSDRKSTLNIYEKIYWRVSGDTNWVLLYVSEVRTIKGNDPDGMSIAIEGAEHGFYDFRIEVYREGQNNYDDYMDPTNNSYLSSYKLEKKEEDLGGSGPVIVEITPDRASAGTESEVEIKGIGFEETQGNGKVEFFYQYGEPLIRASVNSWSNQSINCEVPIGIINGYSASAGSGPVKVTTNSAIESNEYDFRVTFSYGRVKWSGTNPVVNFYVGENISNWADAISKAGNTWSQEANFTLSYAGTTSNTNVSKNGKNEIMFSKLGSGTIGQASYWSSGGKMNECDLTLNSDMKWSTEDKTPSGHYDVETITLHELGHWLNLRDLYGNYGDGEYDMEKVMYGYGYTGRNKRDLHPDDKDGIIYIYGASIPPESSFSWSPNLIYVGDEVSFYDFSKYNPSQWLWDFGDGDTSNLQNPKHTFYFSGIHIVKLRTSNSYGTSEVVKNVVVLPKTKIPDLNFPKNFNFVVPASAKAIGQNQTNWLTDLSIYNPNSESIYVYSFFLISGSDNSNTDGIEILIPQNKMHKISDVLFNLFGFSNNFGAIFFTSEKQFFITSRTYNDLGTAGTYGQFIPAINFNNFLNETEEGYLLNLTQTSSFRTNIGFVNFSSIESKFNISFYKEGGILIGTIPITIKPFSHIQLLSPLSNLTSEEVENGYAVINGITPSTKITGYASIVDNRSSDPIFIPMKKRAEIEGRKHQTVPVIAKAKGAYGTDWRSDLKILNPFQSQNLVFRYYTSGNTFETTKQIPQNSLISYNDIVSSLFPSAPENSSGSLHIYSDNGLFLTSRTYNLVENKTYGQFIPGINEDETLLKNEVGLLLHLTYNNDYRCNIGFTEFSGTPSEVQIKLYDKNRQLLGFKNYSIGAYSNLQIINIFQDLNIQNYYDGAYIEIRILNGNAIYAYASVVDNRTGDSIFIPFIK